LGCDLRHPHRKALDHHMRVERLEDILREQTVVYTRILVLFEFGELVLADVHHVCRAARRRGVDICVLCWCVEERIVVRQWRVRSWLVIARDDVGPKAWNELSPVASLPSSAHLTGVYRWRKRRTKIAPDCMHSLPNIGLRLVVYREAFCPIHCTVLVLAYSRVLVHPPQCRFISDPGGAFMVRSALSNRGGDR
jgi:hypothetical protein